MLHDLVDIAGWAGAAVLLLAYIMLTLGRLSASSLVYHWLNVAAGAGIVANSAWNRAWPSVTINVVWMAIGLYGVTGVIGRRRLLAPERGRE